MRKILALLLLPAFFCSSIVISTERDILLTSDQLYELVDTNYGNYYHIIPTNPNVYEETLTFSTTNLDKVAGKLSPNQPFEISEIVVNDKGLPLFKLANGQFVVADKRTIYDDSVLYTEDTNQTVWLKPGFSIYEKAYVNGVKKQSSNLSAFSPVKITQIATTPKAQYAKIENNGWVQVDYLSDKDNRMEKVQEILNDRYNQADYSIYVKQLNTGQTAGINPNLKMYSASITKLPLLYYAQEQINKGKFSLSQGLKYIQDVNDYSGAYDTVGSGTLPKEADNKEYSVQDLINHIAQESDNAATNILGYYITGKSNKTYRSKIANIAGEKWDVEERNASAKMAGNVMEAIYQQNGAIIDSLSRTNFDNQRISKDIPVKVAHKIGDAYDFKHDVAIVYANSPFILSIFTNHSDYETISKIANDIYEVLK